MAVNRSPAIRRLDENKLPRRNEDLRIDLVAAAAASYTRDPQNHHFKADGAYTDPMERAACFAMALDVMSSRRAKTIAIIGSADTIYAPLEKALKTRPIHEIRFFSRQPVAANEAAKRTRSRTAAKLIVTSTPEEAVHQADIIILATNASKPIVFADWVPPTAFVASLGTNRLARHELPIDLIYRAKTIASDDPHNIIASPRHFLAADPSLRRMVHLGMLVDRFNPDRQRGMTLFLSGQDVAGENGSSSGPKSNVTG